MPNICMCRHFRNLFLKHYQVFIVNDVTICCYIIIILEVKIIVADNYASDIQEEVDGLGFEMGLSFVPIPSDEDWGTADSLRHISDYILVNIK